MHIYYSKAVDRHIYLEPTGEECLSSEQWIDLALAALDQAMVAPTIIEKIVNQLNKEGFEPSGELYRTI